MCSIREGGALKSGMYLKSKVPQPGQAPPEIWRTGPLQDRRIGRGQIENRNVLL